MEYMKNPKTLENLLDDIREFAKWFNSQKGIKGKVVKKRIIQIIEKDNDRYFMLLEERLRYDTKISNFTISLKREEKPHQRDSTIGYVHGYISYKESYKDDEGRVYEYPHVITIENLIIQDPLKRGLGFGSILLENFIKYANQLSVSEIRGEFSDIDATPDNFQRRERFYKKFSFEINGSVVFLRLRNIKRYEV